jgi:hypothetical protein
MENGAGDRIRTGDIDLGKVALYQLSYSRSTEFPFSFRNNTGVKRYEQYIEKKGVINLQESRFSVLCYFSVGPSGGGSTRLAAWVGHTVNTLRY